MIQGARIILHARAFNKVACIQNKVRASDQSCAQTGARCATFAEVARIFDPRIFAQYIAHNPLCMTVAVSDTIVVELR